MLISLIASAVDNVYQNGASRPTPLRPPDYHKSVSIRRTREHFAPLTLLGFYLLGVQQVEPLHYALFKGVWAGLMAAVLVVPMVLCALRHAPLAVSADSGNG
jgi:hypothetical protein